MFDTIYEVVINTPWWVYLLFAILVKIGYKASKTGTVSIIKLSIAPVIFTVMAIETLLNNLDLTFFVCLSFVLFLLLGIAIGWTQVTMQNLKFDRKRKLIRVPGTWSVMVVILIIFASKYYFGYELSSDPNALNNTYFELLFIGVTAVCAGLFVGKLLCYIKRMYTEPHQELG